MALVLFDIFRQSERMGYLDSFTEKTSLVQLKRRVYSDSFYKKRARLVKKKG